MSCFVMVSGFMLMFVVYLVNVVCSLSLVFGLCIVSVCSGCDGCCAFCLIYDACRLRWSRSSSIFVSSCRCYVFVSCCSSYCCVLCSLKFVNVCGGCMR